MSSYYTLTRNTCSLSPFKAPRIHRLPQRLDYTLIPAPLGKLLRSTMINFISCASTLPRFVPSFGDGKIPFTCHHRYTFFPFTFPGFLHRIPRTAPQADHPRTHFILPFRSLQVLGSHGDLRLPDHIHPRLSRRHPQTCIPSPPS